MTIPTIMIKDPNICIQLNCCLNHNAIANCTVRNVPPEQSAMTIGWGTVLNNWTKNQDAESKMIFPPINAIH